VIFHSPEHKHVNLQTYLQVDEPGAKLAITIGKSNAVKNYLKEKDYSFTSEMTKGFISLRKL
jgi:hypothetical protein